MLHVEPYSVSWAKRSVARLTYSGSCISCWFCCSSCGGPNFQSTHMLRPETLLERNLSLSYIQYFEIVQHECTFDVLFLVDGQGLMSCKVILNTHTK